MDGRIIYELQCDNKRSKDRQRKRRGKVIKPNDTLTHDDTFSKDSAMEIDLCMDDPKDTPKVAPIFTREFRIHLAKHAPQTQTKTPRQKQNPKAVHSTPHGSIEKFLTRADHSAMPGS